jgi:hypothetical protein
MYSNGQVVYHYGSKKAVTYEGNMYQNQKTGECTFLLLLWDGEKLVDPNGDTKTTAFSIKDTSLIPEDMRAGCYYNSWGNIFAPSIGWTVNKLPDDAPDSDILGAIKEYLDKVNYLLEIGAIGLYKESPC